MDDSRRAGISFETARRDYGGHALRRSALRPDPVVQFARWYEEAARAGNRIPNAMTLATCGRDGKVAARTVLLKGFDAAGFVFFTDYRSLKARQLGENPFAALVFFWPEIERQVTLRGCAAPVPRPESEAYFKSRPREARLAAWASAQSAPVTGRGELERAYESARARFEGKEVEAPTDWGGFRLVPEEFEFWQGRPNRLNDRFRYRYENGVWALERLQP